MPGVKLTIVGGDVREHQAAAALRSAADLVIWSGHGRENALILTNHRIITGKWIATQAKANGGPRCVILATCGSAVQDDGLRSLAGAVAQAGVNTIGFPAQVTDEAAIVYTTEFVRAMLAGADVGHCHDVACEAIETCCSRPSPRHHPRRRPQQRLPQIRGTPGPRRAHRRPDRAPGRGEGGGVGQSNRGLVRCTD